jgi:hypothetical protein
MRDLWPVISLLCCSFAACGDNTSGSGNHCVPGASAACSCTDGRMGSQTCQSDGTFAACQCTGSGGNGGNGGTGGMAGTGGTGATGGAGGAGGAGGTGGSGGNETVLASGQTNASAIALDDTNVYWTVSTTSSITPLAIMKCPIGGCGNSPTILASTPGTVVYSRIAAAAGMVYWTTDLSVLTCPATGCGTGATSLTAGVACGQMTGPLAINPIPIEPRAMYFVCGGGGLTCPRTGCNGQATSMGSGGPGDAVTDGSRFYWQEQSTIGYCTELTSFPCSRTSFPTSNLCLNTDSVGPPLQLIAVDGVNVYWAQQGATKCNANCTSTSTMTALGTRCGHGLATDGLNVYWSDDITGLVKCSVSGCNGTPTQMSSFHARAIAVDATSVYWTDPSTSSVYKMPK